MKTTKKIITILLCLILLTVCSFTADGASVPTISLSNVTALPGDTVTIDIKISNNPGIMAMSFCITYDSNVFEYTDYSKGYLSKYTIKDHPDKGQIAFVNDETSDKSHNGIMMSVKFLVKNNAAPGKYTVTIANQNREKHGNKLHNSFSNSNLEYIVPYVTVGSITVGETCENAGHKYGGWRVLSPANCTNTGTKEHICVRCEHVETVEIPFAHDFDAEWTVDKAATPTEDGIMSRHCKLCDAVTDTLTFTYEEVEDSQTPDDNTPSDDDVSNDDTSSEANSSESNSSNTQNSQIGTPSDNITSSGNGSNNSNTINKTPINNTVGAKNPQSAVENIKDYQENIKPNLENNNISSDTQSEISSSRNDATSDNESHKTDSNTDFSDGKTDISNTTFATSDIVLLVVGAVISIAVIVVAIILIVRRKKAE